MSIIKIETRNNDFLDSDEDSLYHLGLKKSPKLLYQLKEIFGGVKYVCMGGSPERAMTFADKAALELGIPKSEEGIQAIGKTERCHMFLVGPILSISHGMGMPSLSIFLHEVTKLLDYSGSNDVKFIRIGTSGGVGVEGGTVVITKNAVNAKLEPKHTKTIWAKIILPNQTE
jgi:Uridine phosphorylase